MKHEQVNQELRGPYYNRTKGQNSFIYRGIKFWNSTPLELRNIPNDVNAFKRHLKRFFVVIDIQQAF